MRLKSDATHWTGLVSRMSRFEGSSSLAFWLKLLNYSVVVGDRVKVGEGNLCF